MVKYLKLKKKPKWWKFKMAEIKDGGYTFGGIQTYKGHPIIWSASKHTGRCPNIWGAFKHTGVHPNICGHPNIQGVHPNIWGY